MQPRTKTRQAVGLLGSLVLLAGGPAAAQAPDASSVAPVCRARPVEFQPRVELVAPPLGPERRERGLGVVVLNGRGHNYASKVQAPAALAPLPSSPPAPRVVRGRPR